MISIKRGNNTVKIWYVNLHGNVFALKAIAKSMFTKQYRMLEKYIPDGIYRNEMLDVLASLFSVNIRDQKLADILLKDTRTEIEKLRVNE